jgi:hypothetical protein
MEGVDFCPFQSDLASCAAYAVLCIDKRSKVEVCFVDLLQDSRIAKSENQGDSYAEYLFPRVQPLGANGSNMLVLTYFLVIPEFLVLQNERTNPVPSFIMQLFSSRRDTCSAYST